MAQYDFIVDVSTGRFVTDFLSTRSASSPVFTVGDNPDVKVRLVQSNSNNPVQPWRYIEPTASQVLRLAVGTPGGKPTAGNFVASFDGDDTPLLPSDADGDALESALNSLASITAAGGVTVTDLSGSGFRVSFNSNGPRSLLLFDTDSLSPTSAAYISESIVGSATTSSVQLIAIETQPATFSELTTDIPAPTVNVTTTREGVSLTTSEIKQVSITGNPYIGTYSLLIDGVESNFISYDAVSEEIVTAIEAVDPAWEGLVSVIGEGTSYTIEWDKTLGNIGDAASNVGTLQGELGKEGNINLNTTGLIELLQGEASAQAYIEIQLFDTVSQKTETVLQQSCTVLQDLIPANPASSVEIPQFAPLAHTHTASEITDPENLPISTAQAAVNSLLQGDITSIQALLASDDVALDELQEIVDYIKANRADLDALGIASITGLQAALDAKADQTSLDAHTADTTNPHDTTAEQAFAQNGTVNTDATHAGQLIATGNDLTNDDHVITKGQADALYDISRITHVNLSEHDIYDAGTATHAISNGIYIPDVSTANGDNSSLLITPNFAAGPASGLSSRFDQFDTEVSMFFNRHFGSGDGVFRVTLGAVVGTNGQKGEMTTTRQGLQVELRKTDANGYEIRANYADSTTLMLGTWLSIATISAGPIKVLKVITLADNLRVTLQSNKAAPVELLNETIPAIVYGQYTTSADHAYVEVENINNLAFSPQISGIYYKH